MIPREVLCYLPGPHSGTSHPWEKDIRRDDKDSRTHSRAHPLMHAGRSGLCSESSARPKCNKLLGFLCGHQVATSLNGGVDNPAVGKRDDGSDESLRPIIGSQVCARYAFVDRPLREWCDHAVPGSAHVIW